MGADINAISQSADYHYIRTKEGEITHYGIDAVAAVRCALACAHHTDDVGGVEVGCASCEEHHWGIIALAQAVGVVGIADGEYRDVFLFAPCYLFLGSRLFFWKGFAQFLEHSISGTLFIIECLDGGESVLP